MLVFRCQQQALHSEAFLSLVIVRPVLEDRSTGICARLERQRLFLQEKRLRYAVRTQDRPHCCPDVVLYAA